MSTEKSPFGSFRSPVEAAKQKLQPFVMLLLRFSNTLLNYEKRNLTHDQFNKYQPNLNLATAVITNYYISDRPITMPHHAVKLEEYLTENNITFPKKPTPSSRIVSTNKEAAIEREASRQLSLALLVHKHVLLASIKSKGHVTNFISNTLESYVLHTGRLSNQQSLTAKKQKLFDYISALNTKIKEDKVQEINSNPQVQHLRKLYNEKPLQNDSNNPYLLYRR